MEFPWQVVSSNFNCLISLIFTAWDLWLILILNFTFPWACRTFCACVYVLLISVSREMFLNIQKIYDLDVSYKVLFLSGMLQLSSIIHVWDVWPPSAVCPQKERRKLKSTHTPYIQRGAQETLHQQFLSTPASYRHFLQALSTEPAHPLDQLKSYFMWQIGEGVLSSLSSYLPLFSSSFHSLKRKMEKKRKCGESCI